MWSRAAWETRTPRLRTPEIAQLLARALRPDLHCCGRNLGVGIVGYGPLGGMGYHHGLGVTRTDGLELVAVVDPNVERRKAAETDFPGVRAYASVSDLVNDDDVEVALVATPPAHHVTLTLALLRAGKHVACEKPLCLTVAEADQIIATATASRRMLTVHQNRRWDPDFVALRRAVDAGLLGEIFNVETFVGGYAHPCRTWHSDTAVSGGAGYDWGSHHVDWVLQLLGGVPKLVQAHGHKRVWHDVTNHDQIRVRMTWSDGREAEVSAEPTSPPCAGRSSTCRAPPERSWARTAPSRSRPSSRAADTWPRRRITPKRPPSWCSRGTRAATESARRDCRRRSSSRTRSIEISPTICTSASRSPSRRRRCAG